jgi:hypothetical protein
MKTPPNPPLPLTRHLFMRCRSALGLIALTFAICPNLAHAQAINPVWEYLINKPSPLPVLTNALNVTADNENGNGRSTMDTLSALKRYDANRLLLGIRENGIDETAANLTPAQIGLATNYPDRSLIWINPTNGAPLGIALKVGLYPVPLDAGFIAGSIDVGNTDYTNQYWWSFDVSADGYIYTGYKNKIIRYAPDGAGGISPVPHVIYTLDTNTVATVHGLLYTVNGRWPKIRVSGTGTNTVILAGGNAGSRGTLRIATTDGNNFVAGAWMPGGFGNGGGGPFSSLIPSQDPNDPTAEWVYAGGYPGNSSGVDNGFFRFTTLPPFIDPDDNYFKDSSFVSKADAGSNSVKYAAQFIGDVDAKADLDYVVAYSTPSWNSIGIGFAQEPGWLALHSVTNGDLVASYKINVTEADELLSADQASLFQATIGYVTIYEPTNGPVEVLWSSPVYGYGRYLISDNSKRFTLDKAINTVWEQLEAPSPTGPIAIINSHVDAGAPVANNNTATMTMLTGLKRYDARRLLLGIRDNGINESVPHNTNLANQYPDRSLQWVDAGTGNPLGTALVVNYGALGYADITVNRLQNMAFGVDAAGVVYVGVADKILRYAPAANGTNFLAPSVAFNAATSSYTGYSGDMLFANFRISGSGTNTVLFVANKDWYGPDGEWYLTTTDGSHFTLSDPGFSQYAGGGNSSIVPDPANPTDNLVYETKYPSTSQGVDSTLSRKRQAGGSGSFFNDPFSPQQLPGASITNSAETLYRTFFLTDVQTLPGLDYVVAYSTPSYNTFATTYPADTAGVYNGGDGSVETALKGASPGPVAYQPGWLAIHDQATGNVRGLHQLNVTEALTLLPGFPAPAPHADTTMGNYQDEIPQGGVEMYPFGSGGAEVLWWSSTFGIGRYTIDAPPSAVTPALTIHGVPGGMMQVRWTGLGVLQTSTSVAGPYTTINGSVSGYTFVPGAGNQFFRVIVQ